MNDKIYQIFLNSTGISTDTRTLREGNLFFAIRGPNFNANAFALQALEKGAIYAVVDEQGYAINDRCLLVEDALHTLQDLARIHRKNFRVPFIGITGSNGKTTTKELIARILSVGYRTWATQGNLNNHIGVPLTILSAPIETEMAVIEMGANRPGEIAELCAIAQPTHGLITNIGKAHLEGLGGFDGVLKTKTALYQFLIENSGTAFINSTDPVLNPMIRRFRSPVLYPGENDFYYCRFLGADPYIRYQSESGYEVQTEFAGAYNFMNIAAALCIGKYFGVDEKKANDSIASYIPANNRSQIVKTAGNTLVMDAYNANPTSMEAALMNFENMEAPGKTVILGDMFELGDAAPEEHARVGKLTCGKKFDRVIFCGPLMEHAYRENKNAFYFPDKTSLEQYLLRNPVKNHLVLIKASRGMALETLADKL